MKSLLFTLACVFLCLSAKAQTPITQSKQDTAIGIGSSVVYIQHAALPLNETSQPAQKQIIVTGPEPQKLIETLSSGANSWNADSQPSEKKVVVTGLEPVKSEAKPISPGAVEVKKD